MNKTNSNFISVSAAIFISKVLGFVRDAFLGASLGTTKAADIFMQIFGIPGLFFAGIGVAISSVNIPNLIQYTKNGDKEARDKYVSALMINVTLITMILCTLLIIASPILTELVLPGIDESMQGLAVALMRVMAPTLIFICLTYVTTGILQVHNHFLLPSVISIPFNILIIASLAVWKGNILFLGLVTTIAWALQFLIQLPVLRVERYSLRFDTGFSNSHIINIYKQLIPILLGNSVLQLCTFTDRIFSSNLGEGATSALSYGSNLFTMVSGIFLVAMSTVVFPDLSRMCAEKNNVEIARLLNYVFKVLFFIFIPYLIIVVFYNKDIVRLVYERGVFNAESTAMSSTAFLFYSFCIIGYAFQEVFNRMFYAMGKYRTPMVLGISFALVNTAFNLFFWRKGIAGIAGTTAAAFIVYSFVVAILVKKEIGRVFNKSFITFMMKMIVPVLLMIAVFTAFAGRCGFIIPILVGGVLYIASSWALGALRK